ncbi:hypothetical protein EHEL_061410 [Encephalitozoon hellem ATCC 50504]|uniref:Cell division control Cdc23-like protein n=1 Tax=Encephalitozoon hellem TaxID=27973 RepID=A0A9Q9C6G8_ENCHE|nr:uncharacterized protein EHEL_061410 [Encephalitozoon hellem ATCC 50504]AFM98510.1 hypothetical protein EHEL_061410 [Encephalitozoon hellem ATCC 50504]UTX43437.1 cell division control Cdc23-like protein [Encephalitozoon hellem]|eukprot:XP_003887491.1 hypothetical protein EHEL_061410 [Encephalitozoon hellem ATCC 50504]
MMAEFFTRNLHKTVDFLSKVGITSDEISVSLSSKEYLSLTYQNIKEYRKAYASLLCKTSLQHLEEIVFCACCSQRINFIRNINLLIHLNKPVEIHWCGCEKDEFLLYIEGKVKRDFRILSDVVVINPWFWEAYLDLAELATPEIIESINIVGGLSDFFFMYLFCTKMIKKAWKPSMMSEDEGHGGKWIKSSDGLCINMKYPNLAGAVLYHQKDFDGCIEVFEKVTRNSFYYDLDYIDLYSNALYIKNDNRVILLAENVLNINKYRSEAMCCIANYYSMKKEHEKAIEYFRLSMKLNPSSSIVHTLIGHEYLEMKNMEKAVSSYNVALKMCPMDYRAWYSIGQAYAAMTMYEYALFFIKRALECKNNDSIVWTTLGQCYMNLNRMDDAIGCFKNVIELNDPDGYLYIGDAYKNMKMYTEAVVYYEKYVETSKDDTRKICLFLEEYFKRMFDDKRSAYYAGLANK